MLTCAHSSNMLRNRVKTKPYTVGSWSIDRICVCSHLVTFDLPLSDLRKFLSTEINATLPSLVAFCRSPSSPFLSPVFVPLLHIFFSHVFLFYPSFPPLSLLFTTYFHTTLLTSFPFRLYSTFSLTPIPLLSYPHHLIPIRCDTLT